MRNYYEVLGISRDATPAQIKAAYRKLAKKYHPDSSSGNEEDKQRFQEIQEAYAVLSDPEKRKNYHYYGHEAYRKSYYAQHGTGFGGYGGHSHESGGHGHDGHCGACGGHGHDGHCGGCGEGHEHSGGFDDEYETKDGHCGACEEGRAKPKEDEGPPPRTIRIAVRLELSETLKTVIKEASYTEHVVNPDPTSRRRYVEKEWTFRVKIPRGSYENQYFMLEDVICEGEEFLEYLKARHLEERYVIIVLLNEKPGFLRQGYHLYIDQEVDYHTLVLGGSIQVRTLAGKMKVELPPGTNTNRTIRLENQGLIRPKKIGGRGDLHVTLHVRIPKELTPKQRQVLEMLREVMEKEI